MKIFYKLENNKFLGFYHLDETQDETMLEIKKEEFDELLSHGAEIYYSVADKKLKVVPVNAVKMIRPEFDFKTEKWVEIASLEEIEQLKLEELKNKRIELDESPILFKNKNIYKIDEEKGTVEITGTEDVLIDADFKSKLMIEIAERRLSENEFEMWKCSDNIHRLFSKNELKEVFNKIADRTRELFIKEATLSYQVKNSENIEELNKITWEV